MNDQLATIFGNKRINRNIVECKFCFLYSNSALRCELIETLWNVNKIAVKQLKDDITELIEILWNVNISFPAALRKTCEELIETLWNVNSNDSVNDVVFSSN